VKRAAIDMVVWWKDDTAFVRVCPRAARRSMFGVGTWLP